MDRQGSGNRIDNYIEYGRVIVFDLFGTILDNISNDYQKGLDWLKGEILYDDCSSEDVQRITERFRRMYMLDRTATHREISIKMQLELFRSEVGFKKDLSLDEIEYGFFTAMRITEQRDGLRELLTWLKGMNYSIYIMSNTTFSATTIKRHLEDHGIAGYFDEVYTGGDCGHRKPGRSFFSSVFNDIKKQRLIRKSDVIFVGSSLEKDIFGSKRFGFTPIWISYERDGFGEYMAECDRVKDLRECTEYLMNNFICVAGVPKKYSVADGFGNRLVIHLQGCYRHCHGCHNKQTWDPLKGKIYNVKELVTETLSRMSKHARNVTISGGEPMEQSRPLTTLINMFKRAGVNVCLYTACDINEIPDEIMEKIDYLKTGEYLHKMRMTEKGHLGSSNQKLWKKEDGKWIQVI